MPDEILTGWDKFVLNVKHLWRYATVWVLSIWGLIEVYWHTMMTEAEHQAFYDAIPFGLGKAAPFVIFAITYFVAHGWPQPVLEDKIEVSKAKAIIEKLDGPV